MPLLEADQNNSIANFNKFENNNLKLSPTFSDELNKENSLKSAANRINENKKLCTHAIFTNIAGTMDANPGQTSSSFNKIRNR